MWKVSSGFFLLLIVKSRGNRKFEERTVKQKGTKTMIQETLNLSRLQKGLGRFTVLMADYREKARGVAGHWQPVLEIRHITRGSPQPFEQRPRMKWENPGKILFNGVNPVTHMRFLRMLHQQKRCQLEQKGTERG